MTSAVDLIPTKPVARPEPVAKASPAKDGDVNFADVLETETAQAKPDDDITTAVDIVIVPAQPALPPATPAVNSAEAILAGLTLAPPVEPQGEASVEVPNIEVATPVAPVAATAATPAPATVTAAPTVQVAQAAVAASAPKSIQPAAEEPKVEADDATEPSVETAVGDGKAQPVAVAVTAVAITPVAAPTLTQAPEVTALSAPGAERAATPIESATDSQSKSSPAASTPADAAAKTQTGTNKAIQAAATAEAAPDIKTDAAPSPAPAASVDALTSSRTSSAETARAAQTHPALQNAPTTTIQVYQRMVERFDGRAQRYEVRLDPAELGRVDVRIEVGADKKVHAVLAAHDSAALSDLMRGQRSLERALADAGFDLAEGGIKFELSCDQGRNSADGQNNEGGNGNVWRGFKTADVAVDAQTAAAARPWRSSRLDLVA
ncbi:MAG: flagellar hook-length control protein FliK [Hyphomonadaceae bacterium]|nr:flagellar hook-length control protein FliK [Hyphomonadaceae bacterium]